MKKLLFVAVVALMIGILFGVALSRVELVSGATGFVTTVQEPPLDRVKEDQIQVLSDKVILDVPDVQWAGFTDSNSMHPLLFAGANALQIIPQAPTDIVVGDVISFHAPLDEDMYIIHRVVYVGEDERGVYYIVKGDHNIVSDPGKVRFEQVDRILIGVIY